MSADTLATQRPVLLDRQSLTVDGFRELQLQNRPVLLDADCARTAEWGACREWRVEGGGCGVNFDALRALADRLNDPCVPVEFEDGSESGVRAGYGARRRGEMHLRAYVDAWERLAQSGSGAGADRDSGALPYLKDWHVRRDHGQHVADALYQLPPHFADDWLDERSWRGHRGDDYHFVYAGPANSSTPIHHDVLCTYSWSANVVGRKRWLLFAPGDEALLADGRGGLVPDASPQQHARYPADVAARLARAYGRAIQVEQGPGEVLFVPAGWYHQARARACPPPPSERVARLRIGRSPRRARADGAGFKRERLRLHQPQLDRRHRHRARVALPRRAGERRARRAQRRRACQRLGARVWLGGRVARALRAHPARGHWHDPRRRARHGARRRLSLIHI